MNFFEQQKFVISTLTPVHIGTGEDYEPGNYIIDDGFLYAFEPSILAGKLTEKQSEQLLQIVDNITEKSTTDLQNFFKQHAELAKNIASHIVPVSNGLEQFYNDKLGKVSQVEKRTHGKRFKKVVNKLEIERTIQNKHNNQYYIPGSSIKGAIRTALLNHLNTKKYLSPDEKRNTKKQNQQIQQKALNFHKVDEDPLKFLKITDANFKLSAKEIYPQSFINFCVNKKRKLTNTNTVNEGLYQILECIAMDHYRKIETDIRLFKDKHNRLKSLEINSIPELIKICNSFYLPIFEKELNKLLELNLLPANWVANIQNLMNGELQNRINEGKAFLLKIGKHGGADTKTLDGIRSIYIPQLRKNLPEPTTYWLSSDSKKSQMNMLPYGWILVEASDADELITLKEYMTEQSCIMKDKLKEIQADQKHKKELKIQREKEEKEQRIAEEAAELAQKQQQEMLSKLSEEDMCIKKLELLLHDKKEKNDKMAGGELSVMINEIINDSNIINWKHTYKVQLADFIEESFNFIGWGNKKKKPLRKEFIAKLRN